MLLTISADNFLFYVGDVSLVFGDEPGFKFLIAIPRHIVLPPYWPLSVLKDVRFVYW